MSKSVFFGSSAGLVAAVALSILGAWLLWSHTGHALLAVPYLLLLACPLMHVFHRSHHHTDAPPRDTSDDDVNSKQETRS